MFRKRVATRRLGYTPDLPDKRDKLYALTAPLALLPMSDLRPQCPPVYDQGDLGSCTGNGIAAAVQFDIDKEKHPDFSPSRLFIYYQERAMEGTVDQDAGASIRDGIKAINSVGVCDEKLWPYDVSQFAVEPSEAARTAALLHKCVGYARLTQSLIQMKQCLLSGYPIVIGISVYESFMSEAVASTGIVPMPDLTHETLQGGHCVVVVGHNDTSQRFTVRNSWGTGWGMAGYFTIPYAYLTDAGLAADFWTVRVVVA